MAGRLGGEEFALVLNAGIKGESADFAEALREAVGNMRVPTGTEETIAFTISIGLVEGGRGDDISQLLSAADNALYAAKHGGRNRIVIVSTPDCVPEAAAAKPASGLRRRKLRAS
jgi:two-component system cell cycle response regulator